MPAREQHKPPQARLFAPVEPTLHGLYALLHPLARATGAADAPKVRV